jgi:uncharacterized protein
LSLKEGTAPYNVDLLWQHIAEALPEATRAQLLRLLHDLKDSWSWKSLWSQASSAGKTIAGSLRKETRPRQSAGRKK